MSKKSKPNGSEKLKGKKYMKELRKLQGELCTSKSGSNTRASA